MDKVTLSLKIKTPLKQTLSRLSKDDGRTETYHLERALENYFISKKINPAKDDKLNQTTK